MWVRSEDGPGCPFDWWEDDVIPVGTKVVKNSETWVPSEFDSWGAGEGVGEVVEPPFPLDPGDVDVRWPAGRCFQKVAELIKVAE